MGLIDQALEVPVVTSFTRLGYAIRSRISEWPRLADFKLGGRAVAITGPTSGIGLAAAHQLAQCGATVILIGRDAEKTQRVRQLIAAKSGNDNIDVAIASMDDCDSVASAAQKISAKYPRLDALLHNAGSLSATRQLAASGVEQTVASQVVGPFLLTTLLLENLRAGSTGRVITMSSGGMYTADLEVDRLQMGKDYSGATQYALAKRAQVTLNEMWAQRVPLNEVVFHSMHPGWVDTPGVRDALPTFRRVVGPLLRTPDQGADTLVWLAACDSAPLSSSGKFWLDRQPRSIHRLHRTKASDTEARRAELWQWCESITGTGPMFPSNSSGR